MKQRPTQSTTSQSARVKFTRAPSGEYEKFEKLTKRLVSVPKSDVDAARKRSAH